MEIIPQLSSGGAERFVVDLCNQFVVGNNDVTLVVFFPLDKQWFYVQELLEKVEIISLNKRKGVDLRIMYKLICLILKKKPSVIHSHLRAFNYLLLIRLLFYKIPFYHTVHSDARIDSGSKLSTFFRRVFFKFHLFLPITISDESQKSFESLFHVPSHLIYNGRMKPFLVNLEIVRKEIDTYKKSHDTKVLVNIASVQYLKNQFMLCRCVERLVSEGYDVILLIVGRVTDRTIFEEIKGLDSSRIFLLGEKSNPCSYIVNGDAFCLSSRFEGMPITLIECFSVGGIPICTPVGGIVNAIDDGKNGILSISTDEDDYYMALKRFLDSDSAFLNDLRKNSLQSYENFTMAGCAEKYMNVFKLNR